MLIWQWRGNFYSMENVNLLVQKLALGPFCFCLMFDLIFVLKMFYLCLMLLFGVWSDVLSEKCFIWACCFYLMFDLMFGLMFFNCFIWVYRFCLISKMYVDRKIKCIEKFRKICMWKKIIFHWRYRMELLQQRNPFISAYKFCN